MGEILSDQGHLDEADAHLQRARRVWSGTGERQAVAYADVLVARVAIRRGHHVEGLAILESCMEALRRFGLDAYGDFAEALIAEAEAFAGDPSRARQIAAQKMDLVDLYRPLLQRVSGIALARLGHEGEAEAELLRALESARELRAEYELAATIDVLDALGDEMEIMPGANNRDGYAFLSALPRVEQARMLSASFASAAGRSTS